MRGYFDEEEIEAEEPQSDTEFTLGSGALLGIVFCLIVLCGLCFGFGYWLGQHNSGRGQAAAAQSPTKRAAPDQEPLQASGTIPKPPAAAQAPVAPPLAADGSQAPGSPSATVPNSSNAASPASALPAGQSAAQSSPTAATAQSQPQVRPALPNGTYLPQSTAVGGSPNVRSALPNPNLLMVQVAAVSHEEDADVLVGALRKRGYAAGALRDPADGLIHVRIGPFATREEAIRMAKRLLDDGYNAMVQP
jgi:DedD protein